MVLFRYLEKTDNLLDLNNTALKALAVSIAIATLYNASVFYPQSCDTYNNVRVQGAQSRLQATTNFFPRTV